LSVINPELTLHKNTRKAEQR